MCDAIARGKLRVLIGLLLGVFVIASFEVAQASAASGGEPVTVAKKKKKKCKKGYRYFGKSAGFKKDCYKKRSGSFGGTGGVSVFKIVTYEGGPVILFEGSTGCGPTGEQTIQITRKGSDQPIFVVASDTRGTEIDFANPIPGGGPDPSNASDRYGISIEGHFNPKEGWMFPQYLATSATGWFQVVHYTAPPPSIGGQLVVDCDSGQIAFQVSQS